ncbi:hypothetical protein GXW82_31235 [Streptacidiphilus sp. 4-A2]|nr:hypothetical protein [Streptacidiphilus sp. 4-A2]
MGESVAMIWGRITPYLSMLPSMPPMSPPELVPLWQDLAILTVGLNGMPAAVTGTVGNEHIRFAAQGVKESEDWVRGRLELYAELFGIQLDRAPGGQSMSEHDFDLPYVERDLGRVAHAMTRLPSADGHGILITGLCPRCQGETSSEFRKGAPGSGARGCLSGSPTGPPPGPLRG